MSVRSLERVLAAQSCSDGAGVKLKRSIGTYKLEQHDPFLMLDEIKSQKGADYIAGFPSHPHRGFETVTYMIHGKMQHKDNRGNEGIIESGGVQWMTAGRGIIHSEIPLQEDGLLWGFQLWVNLPAEKKMSAPRYQDIPASQVPTVSFKDGCRVRVVAGTLSTEDGEEVEGCVKDIITRPTFLDVFLPAGGHFEYPLPAENNGFLYCFDGEASVAGKEIPNHHIGILAPGDLVQVTAQTPSRCLLVAAKPIGEPVAKRGPFVMNTQQELRQAMIDFQTGNF